MEKAPTYMKAHEQAEEAIVQETPKAQQKRTTKGKG